MHQIHCTCITYNNHFEIKAFFKTLFVGLHILFYKLLKCIYVVYIFYMLKITANLDSSINKVHFCNQQLFKSYTAMPHQFDL